MKIHKIKSSPLLLLTILSMMVFLSISGCASEEKTSEDDKVEEMKKSDQEKSDSLKRVLGIE